MNTKLIEEYLNLQEKENFTSNFIDYIEKIIKVTKFYKSISESERKVFRNLVNAKADLKFINLASKIAIHGLNYKDTNLLSTSILCLSIEDLKFDKRENLIVMSILFYCCKRLDDDFKNLIQKAKKVSSEKTNQFFEDFYSRPHYNKTLKSMGLKTVSINGKTKIIPIPPTWLKSKF